MVATEERKMAAKEEEAKHLVSTKQPKGKEAKDKIVHDFKSAGNVNC
jgi:hypothetical protein